jgi:hypothetical protein
MSLRGRFSAVNDYPKGMMNLCPCGQVVLAPALYHEGKSYWDNPDKCKELYEKQEKGKK